MLASYEAQRLEQLAQLQKVQQQQGRSLDELKKQLAEEYEELTKQYSLYDAFWIFIQDQNGNWSAKPKLFRYNKITVQEYERAKQMVLDARSNANRDVYEFAEPSEYTLLRVNKEGQEQNELEESLENIEAMIEYHRFLASIYLKMSDQDFNRCDYGKLRFVIGACNYRSEHSFVDQSEGLRVFFEIGVSAYLNRRDIEMINMFSRWASNTGLEPWVVNGGKMYEEDINAYMKMRALAQKGEERKQKKADKIAGYRENMGSGSGSSNKVTRTVRHS